MNIYNNKSETRIEITLGDLREMIEAARTCGAAESRAIAADVANGGEPCPRAELDKAKAAAVLEAFVQITEARATMASVGFGHEDIDWMVHDYPTYDQQLDIRDRVRAGAES